VYFFKYKLDFPILYREKESKKEENYVYEYREKAKVEKKKKKQKDKLPFPGIKNAIIFFANSIKDVFGKIVHYFRLEKFHFKAVAASEDAAKTAELYGVFCTAGATIHQFALNARGIKKDSVYIEIIPDFNTQSLDIYTDIVFSIRIWRIVLILKKVLSVWNNYKKLALQYSSEKENNKENDNISKTNIKN
jgi:hypothetical protein